MSDVRTFGASGDGQTDDTAALEHALRDGEGHLEFPPGTYVLSKPLVVDLTKLGRFSISGAAGTAKILMTAPGPAFHLVGSHGGTAEPKGFEAGVWQRERMPTAQNIEIEGRHPEAVGFLIEGVMQPTFEGVLLRRLLHGIHLRKRARNLLVSHCHIYDNRGVGVFLDHLNLHQVIVTGSHISYCLRGGIVIAGGEIRNVQITGNDIEYNFDSNAESSADLLLDCRPEGSSIREVTIASNTIQAKYSPGGANVRLLGFNGQPNTGSVGMLTLSGNLIGSQQVNVDIQRCRGVVLSGNFIYSGHERNIHIEGSSHVVASGNNIGHNPDYRNGELSTGIRLVDSNDCVLAATTIQDSQAGKHTVANVTPPKREALIEIVRCRRVNLSGSQVIDGTPFGVLVEHCETVNISGSTVVEQRTERTMRAALVVRGPGGSHLVNGNILGTGLEDAAIIDPAANVILSNNATPKSAPVK